MYHVMLVEDDIAVRFVYSKMKLWSKYGFVIEQEAANGLRAVEAFKKNPVDVIFTDICMPLMDGIAMMKAIIQEYPEVLFVLISSHNDFEYAREGLRMGAIDYVVKPMMEADLELVLQRLKEILDAKGYDHVQYLMGEIWKEEGCHPEDPVIQNMCKYLFANMHRYVSMVEIADALKLNKDYFGKLVKSKTGQSFKNLYQQIKIEHAKHLIKSGQYKVYEISEQLGYTSTDYFTRLFKNMTGMTPADYKKQL